VAEQTVDFGGLAAGQQQPFTGFARVETRS
jgi:hypothetical protein